MRQRQGVVSRTENKAGAILRFADRETDLVIPMHFFSI